MLPDWTLTTWLIVLVLLAGAGVGGYFLYKHLKKDKKGGDGEDKAAAKATKKAVKKAVKQAAKQDAYRNLVTAPAPMTSSPLMTSGTHFAAY